MSIERDILTLSKGHFTIPDPLLSITEPGEEDQDQSQELWNQILDELKLQMTTATFNTWLKGSTCRAVDGNWTITVVSPFAVDWLANRLKPKIEQAVLRHAEGVEIEFRAKGEVG